ncbi:hypothetical protein [Bacteroides bouchesdurhonensis]|uniref:hypothetical protein n=1 Tax=Bacteroides bouchesdurhonensis TaxID=1841855 RepID=UPI00097F9574|nr:hypothetical protein [Bacteroides bouchesdurhonensis]
MKHTKIILLSVIICIGGIFFFSIGRITYESKKSQTKEKAREAFFKALEQELKGRNSDSNNLFFFDIKPTLNANIPDSVCIQDSVGKHWYRLDPKKHFMNITDDVNLRFMHSITFDKNPIILDSLNNIWKKYLLKSDISLKSALCLSVTGRDGEINSKMTSHSEWCNSYNLMFTTYIGYACEIEIIGYLDYSLWHIWHMIYKEILLDLLLYLVMVYGLYKISIIIIMKIKVMRQKEIIIVQGVTNTPARSYMLHDKIIFYAELQIIEKEDGTQEKLQHQTSFLLELFLKAKDDGYVLEDKIIKDNLWPDGSGNHVRLHKAVGRLRSCIHKIDSSLDINRCGSAYQLLI